MLNMALKIALKELDRSAVHTILDFGTRLGLTLSIDIQQLEALIKQEAYTLLS